MRPVMILYAKAPVPGRVKTRLAARWGAKKAAQLHAAFVADSLENLCRFAALADIELHTDADTPAWRGVPVRRIRQTAGDLAARLLERFRRAFAAGHWRVIVVGSDSPDLPAAHLQRLLDSSADVALGPCEDGGYYAIACGWMHPRMFEGVQWSTARAQEQSEAAARACGLTVERGAIWYDVDTPADVARLRAAADLPARTRRALAAL